METETEIETETTQTSVEIDPDSFLDEGTFYIANQGEGFFDEVQRLSLAYMNGHPSALEGEPGVGKNQAINLIARAVQRPYFRVRCTEEMTARDIIGGEKLEAEKSETGALATKTVFFPGKLYKGMSEGAIVILDEINQLNPTVQKGLNSALEDMCSGGDLEGNSDTTATEGFGLFLTYNPDSGIANEDLEIAVKDRCKIFYFDDFPAELKLRIALLKSGKFELSDFLNDGISVRGLQRNGSGINFAEFRDNVWRFYGQDTAIDLDKIDCIEPYLYYDRSKAKPIDFESTDKQEYSQIARAIVNTLNQVKELGNTGTKTFKQSLELELDDISRLNINPTSQRITTKLLEDYIRLREMGYLPGQILGDISKSIVDSTVPAHEREMKIGHNMTIGKLVEQIAASNGLMNGSMVHEIKQKVTAVAKEGLVRELMERGYIESVAKRFADEYSK